MPTSASSGHPVAGGDSLLQDLVLHGDGTYRMIDVGSPRPGSVLPAANGGSGRTGANFLNNVPNDPTATSSITAVMMGLGSAWAFTPNSSGKVHVTITGEVTVGGTGTIQATFGARFGTGTAPTNGAANTGTAFGSKADFTFTPSATGVKSPFSFTGIPTLTVGTAYWFDISLLTANASNAASISNLSITAFEL